MRLSRLFAVLALAALPSLAFAGKAKLDDPFPVIVTTGISEFDGVFGKVKPIQDSVKQETEKLKSARANVNTALGVADGAVLADALAELQKKADHKIKVAMEGGTPKLNPEGVVPDEVQKGIDAVNELVGVAQGTIKTAEGLAAQSQELVTACAAFPGKVPSLVKNPLEIASKGKLVGDDIAATKAMPDRVKLLSDEATGIVTDVQAAFK